MSEWVTFTLRDVADVFDGPHATPSKTDVGPWYLSISSLNSGRFDLSRSSHLSDVDLPRWTKRVAPRPGDTLFSYETRLGEASYWDSDVPAALGRRMGLLRPKQGIVEPRYLTYAYLGPQFQEMIRQKTLSGATVDRIPVGEMPDWPVVLPSLETQRKISDIVGSVDDLIENNRRRVEVLEEMARSIYHEWFVKFRYPGHFNVPMVDSALGQIPCDWRVVRFGDLAKISSGKRPPSRNTQASPDSSVPVVGAGSVMAYTEAPLTKSRTLVTGRVGTHGVVQRFSAPVWPSDNTFVLVSESYEYTYQVMLGLDYGSLNRGAAQPLIAQRDLVNLPTLLPTAEILLRFERAAGPLMAAAERLVLLSKRVAALRDHLLPQLVTGKVDVSGFDLNAVLSEQVG
ncbi:restriction endonuclease subunit S [Rhodococcoides fascians]|uniref:Type I restriction modification DNA specificity domain-containing protein n=1 Tax=Rhodococcoides fascians TaxID=1828 RepID=A0A143QTF8_RHOFA|nr:restriction endonuclease subunit S [Rhodococcus fascians]AMY26086.1 hypothetical protein A3Q41_04824 [Rhodococcus fascians]OZC40952.1 restriction endonuclease subunit S [Rhodococcus fascians]